MAGLFASGLRSRLGALLALPDVSDAARASYRRERIADATLPICIGLMEGGFVGVIADKAFDVHPIWLAVVGAAPMFGNLSSAAWARLGQHVRKVPLMVALQLMLIVLTGAVAFLPHTPAGGAGLISLMVAARLVIGGATTIRSVVWTQNYPGAQRAAITWRLSFITQVVIAAVAGLGSLYLDRHAEGFGALYLAGAAIGLVGAAVYSRMRIEEEPAGSPPIGSRHRDAEGVRPGIVRILREDPLFARYQLWQFVIGAANMSTEPTLVYVVSRQLGADYAVSIALTLVLPLSFGVLSLPFWSAYIDRVHIAEFRAWHSWLWVVSMIAIGIGALTASLAWIAVGRAIVGIARGGGSLAWQLGHNDFAHPERAGLYMGLHVTLTGIRGAFAPFVGILLYIGMEPRTILGIDVPGFPGIGGWAILGAALLSAVGTLGFLGLHRRIQRER